MSVVRDDQVTASAAPTTDPRTIIIERLIEANPGPIAAIDSEGRLVALNEAYAQAFANAVGWRPAPGSELVSAGPGRDQAPVWLGAEWLRALAGEQVRVEHVAADHGSLRVFEITIGPIRGTGNRIIGASLFACDISAARAAEMRLRVAVESLPFEFWIADSDDRCVMQNAASRRIRGDAIGKHPAETGAPPDLLARWLVNNRRALAGQTVRGETAYRCSGELRHYEEVLAPIVGIDGAVAGLVGMNIDITARKEAERRLAAEHAVAQVLADATDLDEAAPRILDRLCTALTAEIGELWLPDATGSVLTRVAARAAPGDAAAAAFLSAGPAALPPGLDVPGTVWQSGELTWAAPPSEAPDCPRARAALQAGLNSGLGVPIHLGDTFAGVFCLYARRPLSRDPAFAAMLVSIGRDLGAFLKRSRAERALRESEERLQAALLASNTGTFRWTIADDRVEWDDSLSRLFGRLPGGGARRIEEFLACVFPDDRDTVVASVQECLAGGDESALQFRIVRADGEVRWIEDRARLVRARDGSPLYLTGACADVTERKRAELALRETEATLHSFADNAPLLLGIVELLDDGADVVHVYDNAASCRFFNFPPGRSSPHAAGSLELSPARIAEWADAYRASRRENRPIRFESEHATAQGSRWLAVTVARVGTGASGRERFCYVAEDVTERRCAIEALRASEARLRLALDSAGLVEWNVDMTSGAIGPSPRLNELLGFPADQALTLAQIRSRYHPDDAGRVIGHSDELVARGERLFEQEFRVVLPDGTARWLYVRGEILRDAADRPVRAAGVAMDVTARKAAEDQQRFLLQELNHRVKNTLAVVKSIAARSLAGGRTLEEGREALNSRLKALGDTHSLLTAGEWRGADLHALAENELRPYGRRALLDGTSLILNPKAALTLGLVLHELATNAAKHGSLSVAEGWVEVTWGLAMEDGEAMLSLIWRERGGPPVRAPARSGFGRALLEQGVSYDLRGVGCPDYRAEGLVYELRAPLRMIAAAAEELIPAPMAPA